MSKSWPLWQIILMLQIKMERLPSYWDTAYNGHTEIVSILAPLTDNPIVNIMWLFTEEKLHYRYILLFHEKIQETIILEKWTPSKLELNCSGQEFLATFPKIQFWTDTRIPNSLLQIMGMEIKRTLDNQTISIKK